ncbi:UNVERIFIED_CONTAM: hypothetical protein Sangu_0616800 [Sesamum angustifolium]|uniref:Uncharacterized protein n=1 Tax=Sesamum angustifolium TaxID=2727405 RepID=A0AAW2QC70_9LAMI
MGKPCSESGAIHCYKHPRKIPSFISLHSPKLSIYLLAIFAILFVLFHIQALRTPPSSSWDFISADRVSTVSIDCKINCSQGLKSMASKLQEAVTFLPLKDLRYSSRPLQGHTWFMSSMLDTRENGEVQYQEFPSKASKGRVLCLKGRDTHDGSWNLYALAWPQTLPQTPPCSKASHLSRITTTTTITFGTGYRLPSLSSHGISRTNVRLHQ